MNLRIDAVPQFARAVPIATLYFSGMLQGLTLVSFPASSAVLKGRDRRTEPISNLVGGRIERALKITWIDEGFQQQHRMIEPLAPILHQAPLAQ